jgi:hypothetical protein
MGNYYLYLTFYQRNKRLLPYSAELYLQVLGHPEFLLITLYTLNYRAIALSHVRHLLLTFYA